MAILVNVAFHAMFHSNRTMMKLGQSEEWQLAMEKVTGIREFSAKPLINYFELLHQWLIAENRRNNEFIGWE